MRDEQSIETEATELLRTLIRNQCVNDGTVASVPVETLPAGTSSPRPVTVAVGCDPGCVLTGWKIITSPANAG